MAEIAIPTVEDWQTFLQRWSAELLRTPLLHGQIDPKAVATGWMGFPPSTEAQIRTTEQRLGRRLPPSYRTFLLASNRWRSTGAFIDHLWSAEEVDWFSVRNQSWIDAYNDPSLGALEVSEEAHTVYGPGQIPSEFRTQHMVKALEVSDVGDSAVLLLNPQIVTAPGEWEAWMLANWLPGADRYRSFWELMQALYQDFVAADNTTTADNEV